MTGDGEGASGDEGVKDPDGLRRTCNGCIGLNVRADGGDRLSASPIVIPLGRDNAGEERFRVRCMVDFPPGGSLSRLRESWTVELEEFEPEGVFMRRCCCE